MPAAWPATLPQFMQSQGFQETPPDVVIRTNMETGPKKFRRRTTAGVRKIKGSVRLNGAQRQLLDDFFNDTLAGGALSFDWVHPVTRFAATFRFETTPTYSNIGGDVYQATLALEIQP